MKVRPAKTQPRGGPPPKFKMIVVTIVRRCGSGSGYKHVSSDQTSRTEPRWPSVIAIIAVVALRFSLPQVLRFGPDWILAPVVGVLLVSTMILHELRRYRANQILGCILLAVVTAEMIARVALLIARLPGYRDTPRQSLTAALGIWWSNVLIFASWYWRLDSGGPNARDRRKSHHSGDLLFPQNADAKSKLEAWIC